MRSSIRPLLFLAVVWLAGACAAPDGPAVERVVWVGFGMQVMPEGFEPDSRYRVVNDTPDEPGEVTMVLLPEGRDADDVLPGDFVKIPDFPKDAANSGDAKALLSSLTLDTQFYEKYAGELQPIGSPGTSALVVGNHLASPAGKTVITGTTVGVVLLVKRAGPK